MEIEHRLLVMLCWAPARVLTQPALRAGTCTWNWVLSTDPSLTVRLMTELAAAFTWTMESHMGLFAPIPVSHHLQPKMEPPSLPASPAVLFGRIHPEQGEQQARNATIQSILAHSTWLAYLHDRWQVGLFSFCCWFTCIPAPPITDCSRAGGQ